MSRIAGIVFDKDGTLFDFQASWGGWAAGILDRLSAGDAERRAALAGAIGYELGTGRFRPDSPAVAGTGEEVVARMLPLLPGMGARELAFWLEAEAARAPMCPAVPLKPLMERLCARGLRLGLATNDAEAPARAHLAAAGIEAFFAFVAGADTGHGAKPAPGQLLAFAAATGCTPDTILMVGDSRHDLDAGRAAGMGTVGVLTGTATRAELGDLADVILPDIGHLPGHLDGLSHG